MKSIEQIANILKGAAIRLLLRREVLFKSIVVPILVLASLDFLYDESYTIGKAIVLGTFELMAYTVLAINTHRVMLLGASSVPKWGLARPTKRELRFVFQMIGLGLIITPIYLLVLIPEYGIWLMVVVSSYLISRFSLVFPAIATDNPWTLGEAWDATNEHQFLVFVVVGLLPILIGGAKYLLSDLPNSEVLMSMVSALTTVYTVSGLSLLYESIHDAQNRS
ncbi:MAG: hypothetical protein P8171_22620 [Candidatus Thiodiazotropha sp.]